MRERVPGAPAARGPRRQPAGRYGGAWTSSARAEGERLPQEDASSAGTSVALVAAIKKLDTAAAALRAFEAREDAMSHLRYLDMAVYNNVFSPAGGDAAVSASKDLVRQYVELPAQELAASTKALDILVDLGKVK